MSRNKKLVVDLSDKGLDRLTTEVEEYERWVKSRTKAFVERLAREGWSLALVAFQNAQYDGYNDADVQWEIRGENAAAVIAVGNASLFIEFGAGSRLYGSGHPEAKANGMGPGTYPGQTHVPDPGWWYLPQAVRAYAGGHTTSIGNAPQMPMYNAVKELEQKLQAIATEVFQ